MYKKFLISMLLTMALAGCGQQSSDKQGDQTDTALPVQEQISNPTTTTNGVEQEQAVSPSAVEPTQPLPSTPPPASADMIPPPAGTNAQTPPTNGTVNPDQSSSTQPTTPIMDKNSSTNSGIN